MTEIDILFITACIAAATLLFNFFSIIQVKRQVDLQYKQWEHSNKPVFKFSYMTEFDKNSFLFVVDNINDKFYQLRKIYFTNENVEIRNSFNGTLENKKISGNQVTETNEYDGLLISLSIKDNEKYEGQVVIEGTDSLGNNFKACSLPLQFNANNLQNDLEVTKTYLLNFEE